VHSNQSPLVVLVLNASRSKEDATLLESEGFRVKLGRTITGSDEQYSEDELIDVLRDVDAIMTDHHTPITRKVMQASGRLITVAKTGVGVDTIDVTAATELGILITNADIVENSIAVAEGTLARMLTLAMRLKEDEDKLRSGEWKKLQHSSVRGKTVGIIGLGSIGSQVARLLQPWGVTILATNRHGARDVAQLLNVQLVSLGTLLTNSDFVTIHCPDTPETNKMIGRDQLLSMKRTAFIINTARGSIVDERALHDVLKEGRIAGAAIDVFENEPLGRDSPLLDSDLANRLLLTTHTSAAIPEIKELQRLVQLRNCISALRGNIPECTVNPEVLPRWREHLVQRGIIGRSGYPKSNS
jgi:D-3-phosphoglycerate dehydrogenase